MVQEKMSARFEDRFGKFTVCRGGSTGGFERQSNFPQKRIAHVVDLGNFVQSLAIMAKIFYHIVNGAGLQPFPREPRKPHHKSMPTPLVLGVRC